MAKKAESVKGSSNYFKTLFSAGTTQPANFELQMQSKFGRYQELLTNEERYKKLKISCNNFPTICWDPSKGQSTYAFTFDGDKFMGHETGPFMNFCDVYFNTAEVVPTKTILEQCKTGNPKAGDWD